MDTITVMDASDSQRAFVLGSDVGGMVGALFAVILPDQPRGSSS